MGRRKTGSSGLGGGLHPEVMTVSTVFGYNEVVPKSWI